MAQFLTVSTPTASSSSAKLAGDTFYTEQIGVVGPFKYQFTTDACCFSHFLTSASCGTFFEQIIRGVDTGFPLVWRHKIRLCLPPVQSCMP